MDCMFTNEASGNYPNLYKEDKSTHRLKNLPEKMKNSRECHLVNRNSLRWSDKVENKNSTFFFKLRGQ